MDKAIHVSHVKKKNMLCLNHLSWWHSFICEKFYFKQINRIIWNIQHSNVNKVLIITLILTQTSLSHAATSAWLGSVGLKRIGASQVKPHGCDWKREGVRTTWDKLLREQKQKERESKRERETRSLVSCSQGPSCCSFHYSNAAAWHWINTATGKHCYTRVRAANIN